MMYTMPKNLLSICVNFALATQPAARDAAVHAEKSDAIAAENAPFSIAQMFVFSRQKNAHLSMRTGLPNFTETSAGPSI